MWEKQNAAGSEYAYKQKLFSGFAKHDDFKYTSPTLPWLWMMRHIVAHKHVASITTLLAKRIFLQLSQNYEKQSFALLSQTFQGVM